MTDFNLFDVPEETPPAFSTAAPKAPKPPREPKVELVTDRPPGGVKRFFRRFWKVIAAAAALVLVLVIFGGTLLSWLAPAWTVGHGMEKAASAVRLRLDDAPWGAAGTLIAALENGAAGFELEMPDGSAAVTLRSDFENRDFALSAEYDLYGAAGDAALYINPTRAAVESSWLDDAYGVTFKSFEEDLRASELPALLGLDDEEIERAADTVDRLTRLLDTDPADVLDGLEGVYGEFLKDLDFESERVKVKVSGERLSCTAMTAEIGPRDVRNLALGAYDVLTEDEGFRMLLLGPAAWQDEDALDGELRDARARLKDELEQMTFDLELTCYLYRGQLVKAELQGVLGEDEAQIECTLDLGADPVQDDWHLDCTANHAGGVTRLSADYASESGERRYSDRLTLVYGEDGYEQAVEISADWNKKTGNLDLSLVADDREAFSARCNLERGDDSFRLTLDGALLSGAGGSLALWAEEGGKVGSVKFVNLDRWDAGTLEALQNALTQAGRSAGPYWPY